MILLEENLTMETKLTRNQLRILEAVGDKPSYLYELSESMSIPVGTVAGVLLRLYADGFIEKYTTEDISRRKVCYRITTKGRNTLKTK